MADDSPDVDSVGEPATAKHSTSAQPRTAVSGKAETAPATASPQGDTPVDPRAAAAASAPAASAPAGGNPAADNPPETAQPPRERFWERGRFWLFTALPSWLTSMVVHIIALLVLALISVPAEPERIYNELTVSEANEPTDDLIQQQEILPPDVDVPAEDKGEYLPEVDTLAISEKPVLSLSNELDAAPLQLEFDPLGDDALPSSDLASRVGAIGGTALAGRGAAARANLVRQAGGSAGSEAAVTDALKWFAAHQNSDGSWNLDHRFGPCQNRCGNPGTRQDAVNGATALALLPYLGAGQTHMEGEYKEVVAAGIQYLLRGFQSGARVAGQRFSMFDEGGNYYSHGLGAIVLCEAYAMTKDKDLLRPAQMAIYETAYAQDPVGGGWRYQAQQRGDTSALGWQLMALKSAHMAYLNVPSQTYIGASKFLDSVQAESGAKYGYMEPGTTKATTAVGLLCRMYLGWKRDTPALERGVEFMARLGPSENDMYYNYYATQVMRHYGGDAWKMWNEKMREFLVRSQSQLGHEKGSWFFEGGGHAGQIGGRHYATSMSTMVLEVYYRELPIYRQQAAEEDFPL